MPTSVHIPKPLLLQVDRKARALQISRNRLIVRALEREVTPGSDWSPGFFAKLARPVEFDSLDDKPVDIVFLLLAPEDAGAEHLKALARIARILRDPALCAKLRQMPDAARAYALLTGRPESHAA